MGKIEISVVAGLRGFCIENPTKRQGRVKYYVNKHPMYTYLYLYDLLDRLQVDEEEFYILYKSLIEDNTAEQFDVKPGLIISKDYINEYNLPEFILDRMVYAILILLKSEKANSFFLELAFELNRDFKCRRIKDKRIFQMILK